MKITHFIFFFAMLVFSLPLYAATETAIFAGGCFWSMQHDFDKLNGIVKTTVGYTGGDKVNPSYAEVSTGDTGHYESIQVEYDPAKISYKDLVTFYLHDIDPSDGTGQFCDKGNEYKPVIFYSDAAQNKTASTMLADLTHSKKFDSVAVRVLPAKPFYPAEDYHQKYSDKNPTEYANYRTGCRRDETLKSVWGN